MSNVVHLRPPKPPKPKFQKTIAVEGEPEGRVIVVTIEANHSGLIDLEIKDSEGPQSFEILNSWEARTLAAALVKAADRADRLWAKKMGSEGTEIEPLTLIAALVLAGTAAAAASPLPVPKPPGTGGSCPFGYTTSGGFLRRAKARRMQSKNRRTVFARTVGFRRPIFVCAAAARGDEPATTSIREELTK